MKIGRSVAYGTILMLVGGLLWWQPYAVDLIKKRPPADDPPFALDRSDLFSKNSRVLVVVAHPDDSEYFAAGTLLQLGQSGAQIHQIVATDGDKGYYLFVDVASNKRVRRTEQTQASSAYHVQKLTFLGYPDGRLADSSELQQTIQNEIVDFRPNYLLTFDVKFPQRVEHRDHLVAGEAAQHALMDSKVVCTLLAFQSGGPNCAIDATAIWDRRLSQLAVHKSQFFGRRLELIRGSISEGAIEAAERFGGQTYAEPFRATKFN